MKIIRSFCWGIALFFLGIGTTESSNEPKTPPDDAKISVVVRPSDRADVQTISGRVIADYNLENGERLLSVEDSFGKIHCLRRQNIVSVSETNESFQRASQNETIAELQKEFGDDFSILPTEHFLIVYNTSEGYAVWSGKLFEMLYDSFDRFQTKKNLDLKPVEGPLVAVIFGGKQEFIDYAAQDGFDATPIVAYFHRTDNRTILYDLSEEESKIADDSKKSRSLRQVEQILSRPQAAFNVATIVHEATHQITFNRKMILRSGPFPLWLAEGTSMFFETPDANATKGWSRRGSSKPNPFRRRLLNEYFQTNPSEPIQNVIRETDFMKNADYSYAVAWALFYYLNDKKPKQLVEYIRLVSQKPPFSVYSPEERLQDFESVFGDDWTKFYQDFLRYFQKIPLS